MRAHRAGCDSGGLDDDCGLRTARHNVLGDDPRDKEADESRLQGHPEKSLSQQVRVDEQSTHMLIHPVCKPVPMSERNTSEPEERLAEVEVREA
jgi:hypothetical protein